MTRLGLAHRLNALWYTLAGLLMLSATWDGLFSALRLPIPDPPVYAQLLGLLLLGLAMLLWRAGRDRRLAMAVARPIGLTNLVSAAIVALWLVRDLAIGHGKVLLSVAVGLAAVIGALQLLLTQQRATPPHQ